MLLGSGLRFPAFIGALSAIEEKGIEIERVVGASAGSIIGSLYAAGWSPAQMRRAVMDLDTTVFRDFSLKGLLAGKGLYEGRAVEEYVDGLLEGRRFSDGFRMPPFVVATDIRNNIPFVFSKTNFPDMRVSQAIRYSIGIPLVFSYKNFSHSGKVHTFVDGNLLSGMIAEMFHGNRLLILKVVSNRTMQRNQEQFGIVVYLKKLVLLMMNAIEKERVVGRNWQETILISCGDIHTTKFNLSRHDKTYLLEQGYGQVRKYLEYKWECPPEKIKC